VTALNVEWLVEDGFVVAGTLDPHVALAAAAADDDELSVRYSAVEMGERGLDEDDAPSVEATVELGDALHELIGSAVARRWRWIPATAGEAVDHGVERWLSPAVESGPDTFEGVAFL
jgi:hypothetical protein